MVYRGGMLQEDWAFGIARVKVAGPLPRRWAHVHGVARRARQAAPLFGVDGGLLVMAAVLHDIGYAPDLVDTGFHAIDGAQYLQSVGASERLVCLVAHHSCAVLEAELRGLTVQLAEFDDEKTPLRDALWWADMTTMPDGRPTTVEKRVQEIQARYGPADIVSRFIQLAQPKLKAAIARTEMRMSEAGLGHV